MKPGIYLGPPVGRTRGLGRLLVFLAVGGTIFHAALYVRELRELDELRADVARRESATANVPTELDAEARAVLARLRAASAARVATTIAPTELLQIVASALPDEVALVGVSLEPSAPRPSLLIDAVARREEDVTVLEQRMAASERVAATKLLGERSAADGTYSVRLQVDLNP